MRRGISSLILALSLVVASVAWSGFVMLHTVLDPGRSERLADQMLDNAVLRRMVVGTVADSIQAGLPPGVEVPRQEIDAAATAALADPRAEALVRDGMVRVHRNALEGVDEPVVLDPTAFGVAARDALVQARPELAAFLPAPPPVSITLPDAGLSFLGTLSDFLERAVLLAALGAVAGVLLALGIARNRPRVLRRVALWAFAASAFWLILGLGVPWLAENLAPSSAALFAAAVDVFLGAMVVPALFLATAGAVLVVAAMVWDLAARERRGATGRRDRFDREPAPVRVPAAATPPPRPYPAPQREPQPTYRGPADATWHGAGYEHDDVWAPALPPTDTAEDPWAPTRAEAPRSHGPRPMPSPRWVEGVGYVEE